MSFKTSSTVNGNASVVPVTVAEGAASAMISNDRYEITEALPLTVLDVLKLNCHEELVRSGAYKGLGMKMDALLEKMI